MATKKLPKSALPGHPHHMQWLVAVLLITAVAISGLIILRFSNAGSNYSNGCWIYNTNLKKYQFESSASSCTRAEQRGRTLKPAAGSPASVQPSNAYPNGCDIYVSNHWAYESSPESCSRAASRGQSVRAR